MGPEDLASLPDLTTVAWTALPWWRGLVAALGAVLIGWAPRLGDRGVHVATFVAAVVMGHLLVWMDGTVLGPGKPWIDAGTVAILAAIVMWVADWNHRLALAMPGAMLGLASVGGALGFVMADPSTHWAAAGAGALLLPFVYESVPGLLGPAVGAVALGWAYGSPASPSLVGGAFLAGIAIHLFRRRRRADIKAVVS